MKLMLTSSGITNDSLKKALLKLIDGDVKIAFIPTGANPEEGDKDWLIDNLKECSDLGEVDIVDISAMKKEKWLPRLKWANVIFVGGGNTVYLMGWIEKSGLLDELGELLEERIYVGISAGSIVLSKTLFASSEFIYLDEDGKHHPGLDYVDFHFRPHFNSPHFPRAKEEFLKEISKKFDEDLYAIDDDSGIVCIDGKVEVVSEGKWMLFSKKKK